jgi:hypothetical protein
VQGSGGLPSASQWLTQLSSDPDLANLSVGSISVKTNGGTVNFSSSATITPVAESARSKGVAK